MNSFILTVTILLYFSSLAFGQNRKLFTWIDNGLAFEGLSRFWTDDGGGSDCTNMNIKIAMCTTRYCYILIDPRTLSPCRNIRYFQLFWNIKKFSLLSFLGFVATRYLQKHYRNFSLLPKMETQQNLFCSRHTIYELINKWSHAEPFSLFLT